MPQDILNRLIVLTSISRIQILCRYKYNISNEIKNAEKCPGEKSLNKCSLFQSWFYFWSANKIVLGNKTENKASPQGSFECETYVRTASVFCECAWVLLEFEILQEFEKGCNTLKSFINLWLDLEQCRAWPCRASSRETEASPKSFFLHKSETREERPSPKGMQLWCSHCRKGTEKGLSWGFALSVLILLQYIIFGMIILPLCPSISSIGFIYTDSNIAFLLAVIYFLPFFFFQCACVTNESASKA